MAPRPGSGMAGRKTGPGRGHGATDGPRSRRTRSSACLKPAVLPGSPKISWRSLTIKVAWMRPEWCSSLSLTTAQPRSAAGTRDGPRAIIEASYGIEDYDGELDLDVSSVGVHTTAMVEPHMGGPDQMVQRVRQAVSRYVRTQKNCWSIGRGTLGLYWLSAGPS